MLASDKRYFSLVGGSRSSKTYSILQYILVYALKHTGKSITIARKTFPALRRGAYKEFIKMLESYGMYDESNHNKTENIIKLHGNEIMFMSLDQSAKLHGIEHDLIFIDECTEVSKAEIDQVYMRTRERIILAQNPSNALHWSLALESDPDCLYIHSTYVDNPFLPQGIINQIESYRETDPDHWLVYGLGLPAKNNELVYNHQQYYSDDDLYIVDEEGIKHPLYEDIIYGLDFGWNHPTALIKIHIDTNKDIIWCEELIHESYLTTADLIERMKDLNIGDSKIYCDSAEPKTIEAIRRAGFDSVSSMKEVIEGINMIKSFKLFIHNDSTKLQSELRRYKWKMKNEMKTDEPIKLFDDGLCAIRYATFTYVNKTKRQRDYDFDFEII